MGSRNNPQNRTRVVWVWGIGLLIVIGWAAGHKINTSDHVTNTVPEDTAIVAQFSVKRTGWDQISKALDGVTLISNRPLSIHELPWFVEGEFAIFISSRGHRTISVHSSDKRLPKSLLESRGIVVQKTGDSSYLLSDRREGTTGYSMPNTSLISALHWPPTRLGTIAIDGVSRAGIIRMLPTGNMEWRFPHGSSFKKTTLPPPPKGTLIFLSTPVWTQAPAPLFSSTESILSSLATWDELTTETKQAEYAVSRSDEMDIFLFKTKANIEHPEERIKLLRLASAVRSPKTRAFQLPDGETVRELLTDPSAVTVESVSIAGAQAERVTSGDRDGELLSLEREGNWYYTNSRAWLEAAVSETHPTDGLCKGSLMGMDTAVLSSATGSPHSYWPYPITDLTSTYSAIGLHQSFTATIFTFCR